LITQVHMNPLSDSVRNNVNSDEAGPPPANFLRLSSPHKSLSLPIYTSPRWQQQQAESSPPDRFGRPSRPLPTASLGRPDGVPPSNRLDLEKIVRGWDARSTVMVKDVPNKLSRSGLIAILDSVLPRGSYDFVYLRFDFSNRTNMGCTSPFPISQSP
jgi:hypothetical protein